MVAIFGARIDMYVDTASPLLLLLVLLLLSHFSDDGRWQDEWNEGDNRALYRHWERNALCLDTFQGNKRRDQTYIGSRTEASSSTHVL